MQHYNLRMQLPGSELIICYCQTSCQSTLGSMLVILIPCWPRNFVMSEHTNVVIFFVAYSEYQSVWLFIWRRRYGCSYGGGDMVVHMVEEIAQDTNSELQHWFDFTSMKESLSIHVIQA